MRTPTPDLWELVHKLSAAEKRYFRIQYAAGNGKDSVYMKIFDVMESQKSTYNETSVRKSLGSSARTKNLSIAKNYLQDTLLESLEQFHAANSTDITIRKYLNYADILRNKNLHSLADKYLEKALETAEKYERFPVMLECLHKLSLSAFDSGDLERYREYTEDISIREKFAITCTDEIIQVKKLMTLILPVVKSFGMLSEREQKNVITELKKHEIFSDISRLHSFHARSYAYTSLGALYSMDKDILSAYRIRRSQHMLFRDHPHFITDKIQQYAGNLYNLSVSAINLQATEHIHEWLEQLKEIPQKYSKQLNESNSVLISIRAISLQLQIMLYGEDYRKTADMAEQTENIYREHPQKLFHEYYISSFLFISIAYLLTNQVKESLRFVNMVLNFPDRELRKDIQLLARFVNLAIHHKLGNIDVYDNELRNLHYYTGKKFLHPGLEARAVKFFEYTGKHGKISARQRTEIFPLMNKKEPGTVLKIVVRKIEMILQQM